MTDRTDKLKALLDERIVAARRRLGRAAPEAPPERGGLPRRVVPRPLSDVGGDPDLLNITQADVILELHREYFAAGADIATTNTFTATSIGQADYGLESHVAEMNREGARLARQAADEVGGFVAGSLGPLNVALSVSAKVDDPSFRSHTFDQVREAYAEQIARWSRAASTCC